MSVVCILRGPIYEYNRYAVGDRWCFRCRKHLPHDNVLMGEPPPPEDPVEFQAWLDEGYGYYEPSWALECSRCKNDCTDFPGTRE